MKFSINDINTRARKLVVRIGALCALIGFMTSCNMINEDLDPCPHGLKVRLVYDYNMERANAFNTQVDCVTLYVFDSLGNLLEKHTENSDILKDESYRMELDLEPGNYSLMAIGGTSCALNSFRVPELETRDTREGIFMQIPLDDMKRSDKELHHLFYGDLQEVTVEQYVEKEVTVFMMKDTNSIQIALQEVEAPHSVDVNDYEFVIEADNELLGHDNNTIPSGGMIYDAYSLENRISGYIDYAGNYVVEDTDRLVQIGVAEFMTSRLMVQNADKSFIVIKSKSSGNELIRVPLIDYMVMTRHNSHSWLKDDQEYLDRQSTWSFMFFLQNGKWINSRIAVNNWILRFNHANIG